MASGIYNVFKGNLMNKLVSLGSAGDTVKVALMNNSHTFSAANTVFSDVSANEASGTNYTAGGATLANKSVTVAATTKWDADDATWATATITAYHAVVYDVTNSNSLVCSFDFGGAKTATAGTFTIQWDANGLITLA